MDWSGVAHERRARPGNKDQSYGWSIATIGVVFRLIAVLCNAWGVGRARLGDPGGPFGRTNYSGRPCEAGRS